MSLAVRGGSIRRAVDGWLDAADRKRIRIADIGSAKAQTAFVRAGLGWSIVSEVAARESAAAGRLDLPRRRSGRYRFLARLLAQGPSFDSGHNIHAVGGSSVRFVVATAL